MSKYMDPDSPDYNDTNVGEGMVPSKEEREAARRAPSKSEEKPLTEAEIESLRPKGDPAHWDQFNATVNVLCDMAINSLLYGEEIQRLRGDGARPTARLPDAEDWEVILGGWAVDALQGNFDALKAWAKAVKIEMRDGVPIAPLGVRPAAALKRKKLKPEQERMRDAVASLQQYMATYDQQTGYLDYSDKTYLDDVLYGLGRSLGAEYEFAGGFAKFKDVLRHHLGTESATHLKTNDFSTKENDMEEHGIGWAIKQLHNGSKVRRAGWNGKGMWLMLVPGSHVGLREGTPYDKALNTPKQGQSHVTINPHIDMYTADGKMQPGWLASQTDLLATDWEIAE